jgi:hypothetical protein
VLPSEQYVKRGAAITGERVKTPNANAAKMNFIFRAFFGAASGVVVRTIRHTCEV